ncbi:hypothetical protein MB901379_00014 [Mycobacterium basiliense]|uniref:Uncharacterized protein n=1 Tax=Mycobacterium basiliense TaxID=2094119 RepID=A0A447G7P6_9MYCO|nr:hypothetical protein [Mycobacterium basiliense]VDM86497.1 hypothetical protein MB901379_00014 [Mycobacterium basiliense]
MRYFKDYHDVARVDADEFGHAFLHARAETFNYRTNTWREDPMVSTQMMLRGEYESCTQAEAEQVIADFQARRRTG